MPVFLHIDGEDEEWMESKAKTSEELLEQVYTAYKASADEYQRIPSQTVDAVNSLYVFQREFAVIPSSHDDCGISIVGSDDATTCHIIILRCPDANVTSVGHFDDANTSKQLATFVHRTISVIRDINILDILKPVTLDLYIIGGFNDGRFLSEAISRKLLWLLHTQPPSLVPAIYGPINFQLKLACFTKLNTILGSPNQSPVITSSERGPAVLGAAVDLKSGSVFPCTFKNRGPEASLRCARAFSDEDDLMNVYSYKSKELTIEPFPYYRIINAEKILELPDEWILQNMSTSPNNEPAHFATAVKEMLKFTISNPDWQEAMNQEAAVRWVGDDSPNVNMVGKCSRLPIGCSVEGIAKSESRTRPLIYSDDSLDALLDPQRSSLPPWSKFNGESSRNGFVLNSPTTSDPLVVSGKSRSPTTDPLSRLRSLIAGKRRLSSPAMDENVTSSSAVLASTPIALNGSLPSTSTPTAASTASGHCPIAPNSSRRNRPAFKRHRLFLSAIPLDEPKVKDQGSLDTQVKDQNSLDDSLIAGLDLDAFLNDARKKNAAPVGGTPFKRRKTTGDLSDSMDNQFFAALAMEMESQKGANTRHDDVDSFFANGDVMAEVEKMEVILQSQRIRK